MAANSETAAAGSSSYSQAIIGWFSRHWTFLVRLLVSAAIIVGAVGIHDTMYGSPESALAAIAVIITVVVINVFFQPLKRLVLRLVG